MLRETKKSETEEISAKAISKLIGAATGTMIAGPVGALIGVVTSSVVEDMAKGWLSPRELSRMEKILSFASEATKTRLESGTKPRIDISEEGYKEVLEGFLLKAKVTYEEKKLPFLGKLLATAPFTNTPIDNLNQTLLFAEQLSYRQLCLLSIIDRNRWDRNLGLSEAVFQEDRNKGIDEKAEGVYHDLYHMISLGLVGQLSQDYSAFKAINGVGLIVPNNLDLHYSGRLLVNGMQLSMENFEITDSLLEVLK